MLYHIYTDESRQSKDRFMVLGGLIIEAASVPRFDVEMSKFREETRMFSELKWTKVTDQKIKQYMSFVRYFFLLLRADEVHFHCLILDTCQINHKKFNRGDGELGFYKFYYKLLLHSFGKRYCHQNTNGSFISSSRSSYDFLQT
jgi:hypothetical protein